MIWPLIGWTLAAGLVWLALRLVPRQQVWLHYRLRLGLLLALPLALLATALRPESTPVLWEVTLPEFVVSAGGVASVAATRGLAYTTYLSLALFVGFMIWQGVRLVLAWRELKARRMRLTPVLNPDLLRLFQALMEDAGFRRAIALRMDPESRIPYTFGFLRPVVVLPAAEPDPRHWRELLTHELIHVRRADYLWQWVEELQRLLFAWHPLWNKLVAEIRLYRELTCDAEILAVRASSPRTYAGMLLAYALLPDRNPRAVLSMSGSPTDLKTRIEDLNHHPHTPEIMKQQTSRSMFMSAATLAAIVLTVACTAPSEPVAEVPQPETSLTAPGDEVFIVVEKLPEPVGGMEALMAGLTYPQAAKDAGVEGRVVVEFIVDETGAVSDAAILRGIGHGCDEAALDMVRKATFTPGQQRGRNVKVKMNLPVVFRL